MCHELREVIKLVLLNMVDSKTSLDAEKNRVRPMSDLLISFAAYSRKMRGVVFTELEECSLPAVDLKVKVVAFYLDPRQRRQRPRDGKRPRQELFQITAKMGLDDDRSISPQID